MKFILSLLVFSFSFRPVAQPTDPHIIIEDVKIDQWFPENKKQDLKDKTVVIEFWATWCKPCINAIPHFNELAQSYGNDSVIFISLNSFESAASIQPFIDLQYFESIVASDKEKHTLNALNITLIPKTVIIDKKGELRWVGDPGQLTKNMLDTFLRHDQILEEPVEKDFENNYTGAQFKYEIKATTDRSVSQVSFHNNTHYGFTFENKGIDMILTQIFGILGKKENEYSFTNNPPLEPHVDLEFLIDSAVEINRGYQHILLDLAKSFEFKIDTIHEEQTIIELEVVDQDLLKKHHSNHPFSRQKEDGRGILQGASIDKIISHLEYIFEKPVYMISPLNMKMDVDLFLDEPQKNVLHLLTKYGIRLREKSENHSGSNGYFLNLNFTILLRLELGGCATNNLL